MEKKEIKELASKYGFKNNGTGKTLFIDDSGNKSELTIEMLNHIISFEEDEKLIYDLSVTSNLDDYSYSLSDSFEYELKAA